MGKGRRQHLLDQFRARLAVVVLAVALCGAAKPAYALDGWLPDAGLFPADPAMRDAAVARVAGRFDGGQVPVFRSAERDRMATGVDGAIRLAPVELRARWDWLVDRYPAGSASGPGDVRLGTVVTALRPGHFDVTLGWEAKLPDASDEQELGTDETDILFGASAGFTGDAATARVGVGLAVLGNPLRFANQDDVPMIRAQSSWSAGAFTVLGEAALDLPTPRNPARAEGDIGVRVGHGWHALARGGGGLVPASADWHLGLAVGYAAPLPGRRPGA